ncbi:MAG: glycine transferase [Butyrivibrio sp.]|nr:glycine transferase [Butyrivibrio sp.]
MKKLAGHQTYFFPYIGYFSVMNAVDYYVYCDEFQFKKQGWMNRNRIIGEDGNIKYIIVPVKKHSRETPTNEIQICYDQEWEKSIIDQLGYYKRRAPFYNEVIDMLQELFTKKYVNLAELNIAATNIVLERLGVKVNRYKMSELRKDKRSCESADEWGIYLCKCFESEGVDTFTNAPGGKEFYDTGKYAENGLNIEFLQNNLSLYDQGLDTFVEGLSIIDVLMFNSPEQVRKMMSDYHAV